MTWTRWLLGAGAALALGAAALPAQAAPAGSLTTSALPASAGENGGIVEKAHVGRRCWRHYGHWHCRRASCPRRLYYSDYAYYPRRHYYGPAYYYGYPRYYRYRHRPAVALYGPGFGFSFGPRYRYGW